MIKHGVVMVTSLIIILSLLGVVSASDITASDVDMQSLNQEDTQIEIAQTSDTSTVESESDDSSSIGVDVDTTLSDSGTMELKPILIILFHLPVMMLNMCNHALRPMNCHMNMAKTALQDIRTANCWTAMLKELFQVQSNVISSLWI